MRYHRAALTLAAAALAACSSAPEPVPVVADAFDLAQLAGEWAGHYSSPSSGRHGSIVFSLKAGRDTAYGDVTMIPRGWTRPLGPVEDPAAAARDAPPPQVLGIAFVRVEGGVLSGTLDAYRDPDCGCIAYTTFTGEVKGDVIEGEFLSRLEAGHHYTGTWMVRRKKG